jgi:Spy/CpxP family protein refolding chaperone
MHAMNETTNQASDRRKLRPMLLGAAFACVFVGGGALAAGAAAAHPGHGGGATMMMGPGGHGGMHAMGAEHLGKLLDEAGASAEQKAKIHEIMQRGLGGMKPMHGQMQQAHAEIHDLLTAPTIDRAALERLRAQHIAEMDRASRGMVAALADAAEVLTPAQRAKLRAAMQAHHAEHGGER